MTTPNDPYNVAALEMSLAAATTPEERTAALARLGFALGALGEPERGLALTQEARALATASNDESGLWRATYYSAVNYIRMARYPEALPLMRVALEIAERRGEINRQAISLDGIASLHSKFGDLPAALTAYERCLELRRAAGRPDNEAGTLSNLARVYDDMGDFGHARELREQVVALGRQHGTNVLSLAGYLNNLGYSHIMLGEFEQAADRIEEALQMAREVGGRHVEAYCLSNLAKLQDGLGRPDLALPARLQALDQSRTVGDRSLEAEILAKLGRTYQLLGAHEQARETLVQSLALHEELGEKKGVAEALLGLSEACEAAGDFRAALSYHQRYHDVERTVLGEEAERSARLLSAKFEAEAARREAELHRLEKVELAQAYEALRVADAERRELLARLEHQAHHDSLTGLGNRRAFDQNLDQVVSVAQRQGDTFGVMMIDLDGLKAVNDLEGHERGDGLLRAFAEALRAAFRNEDRVFRLGGDEYAVILDRAVAASAQVIQERVRRAVQLTREAGYAAMDASAGLAFFPEDAIEGPALTRLADERMYTQKQDRRLRRA